ncbi:MAG: ribonuclease P protein component [Prevotella sp.]|nr:ribonuclease P protein component [Candidatus Prevotella equi]
MNKPNAFPKSQRLCSRYLIDKLFMPGNSRSQSSYPLRLVYHFEDGEGENELLISVPKRCFKHAVDRNHVKRQVREAYRNNRDLIHLKENTRALMAMIWLDNKHYPSAVVTAKVRNLLQRMSES